VPRRITITGPIVSGVTVGFTVSKESAIGALSCVFSAMTTAR
jgi:hypothetical protein